MQKALSMQKSMNSETPLPYAWAGWSSADLRDKFMQSGTVDHREIGKIALDANGSFAGIRRDKTDEVLILTDHSGSIPVYYGTRGGRIAVGLKPGEVADELGESRIDPVSAADFIINATVCYPYTLFEDVFVAPPGTVSQLTPAGIHSNQYYRPEEGPDQGTAQEWGRRLREGVRGALCAGLVGCRKVKVLYSGGEDARSVVSLLPRELDCELVTLADTENREVRLAHRAARVQGRRFTCRKRPVGFYRQSLKARTALIGAAFDIRHTHVFGATAEGLQNADAILGGYTADTLFKSAWMGNIKKSRRRLGPERVLSDRVSEPVGVTRAASLSWIAPGIARDVDQRRRTHHRRLAEFRPLTAGNWHTLWPMGTQRITYAHYLACNAIGPRVLEPFLDGQVYRIAAAMPDRFRADRKAFRAAFSQTLGHVGWLPTSSGRLPNLGGHAGHWVELAIVLQRKLLDAGRFQALKMVGRSASVQGSWSPDHKAWDFQAEHVPDPQALASLGQVLSSITEAEGGVKGADMLMRLDPEQRLRALQVSIWSDDRAHGEQV